MAHALGIKSTLLPALVATFLCKVLPKSGPRLLKLPPIFAVLNGQFSRAIAKLSWAEMEVLFAKHDVWYELGCVRGFAIQLWYQILDALGQNIA